jgi:hypothetical protein
VVLPPPSLLVLPPLLPLLLVLLLVLLLLPEVNRLLMRTTCGTSAQALAQSCSPANDSPNTEQSSNMGHSSHSLGASVWKLQKPPSGHASSAEQTAPRASKRLVMSLLLPSLLP